MKIKESYIVNSFSELEDILCEFDDGLTRFCLELDCPGVLCPLLTTGEMDGDLVASGEREGVNDGVIAAEVRLDS